MASSSLSMSLPPRNDTFLSVFVKHQIWPNSKPAFDSLSVAGKTAVITGGNVGIGLECGKILLSLGLSHLILAVRSLDKGEAAARPLRRIFPQAKIDAWHVDMSSYDSIRSFSRRCADLPRLDVAILSAGIMNTTFKTCTSTGHEEMIQVNYLSTALLGILLLPTLKRKGDQAATPGRLVMVASGAALIAPFAERNESPLMVALDKNSKGDSSAAKARYDTSKGLVLMLTHKLSMLATADDVVVNVVDPSFTPGTSFFREMPLMMRVLLRPLTALLGTTVNNAAWRYVDAAVARGPESHGSFISDWEVSPFHAFMYTDEGRLFFDRLWDETVGELDFPEVHNALDGL